MRSQTGSNEQQQENPKSHPFCDRAIEKGFWSGDPNLYGPKDSFWCTWLYLDQLSLGGNPDRYFWFAGTFLLSVAGDLLFGGFSGDFLGTFWGLSGDFLGTFWGFSGDFLGTFLGTFLGAFLGTFWELSGDCLWLAGLLIFALVGKGMYEQLYGLFFTLLFS